MNGRMPRFVKQVSAKAGLAPGTLMHIGRKRLEAARITVIDYDAEGYAEKDFTDVASSFAYRDTPTVSWIDVRGLHDTALISGIGEHFHLHPLLLEDILTTGQRPKLEDAGDYLCVFMTMFSLGDTEGIQHEQVTFVIGPRYVISFQEGDRDVFGPVRERLRGNRGMIRKLGADYLAYALMDAIVDNYFVVLERMEEAIEQAEEAVLAKPEKDAIHTIYTLKNEVLFMRRAIWPLREVVSQLQTAETPLIPDGLQRYFKDLYDHTIQIIETIDTYWEIISEMRDAYLSSLSNRLNEVMKILTIFSTIFIPLTFIVGIYGMNFDFMPELRWHWGYPALMLGMAGIVAGMLAFFKKRRWI